MSNDHTYNGWRNYETWVTALWIDNDQGSYNARQDIVAECIELQGWTGDVDDLNKSTIGDALKEWAEESFIDPITESDNEAGLAVDLLRAAWSEVDWYEIVEHWLEDALEDDDRFPPARQTP